MQPLISIIITVYNRERYLIEAISSILAQSRGDFELLIWDDGSTDNSLTIAHNYASKDERIRIIAAKHQGRATSLKLALEQVRGTYVCWVDSDDILALTALEATTAIFETNPSVGMVYTNYLVIDEKSRVISVGKRCHIPYSKDRLLIDFMTFHFRLIRRCFYEQVGGIDVNFLYAQDYDLCLKLSEVTEICHLREPLYFYRTHPQSISQEQRLQQIEYARQAIANALERRGLSNRYEIKVEIVGRFSLEHKSTNS